MEERLTEDDWERLAPLAIAGDADAFGRLLVDLRVYALRHAASMVAAYEMPDDPEDMASYAVLHVIRYWGKYDATAGVPLVNFMKMLSRSGVRRSVRGRLDKLGVTTGPIVADPPSRHESDPLEARERESRFASAIDSLSPRQAEATKRFYGVCGHRKEHQVEIAASMGLTQQAVAGLVKRAERAMAWKLREFVAND